MGCPISGPMLVTHPALTPSSGTRLWEDRGYGDGFWLNLPQHLATDKTIWQRCKREVAGERGSEASAMKGLPCGEGGVEGTTSRTYQQEGPFAHCSRKMGSWFGDRIRQSWRRCLQDRVCGSCVEWRCEKCWLVLQAAISGLWTTLLNAVKW